MKCLIAYRNNDQLKVKEFDLATTTIGEFTKYSKLPDFRILEYYKREGK